LHACCVLPVICALTASTLEHHMKIILIVGVVLTAAFFASMVVAQSGLPQEETTSQRVGEQQLKTEDTAADRLRSVLRRARHARGAVEFEVRLERQSEPRLTWARAHVLRAPQVLVISEHATTLDVEPLDFVSVGRVRGVRFHADSGVQIGSAAPVPPVTEWLALALQDGSLLGGASELRSLESELEDWDVVEDNAVQASGRALFRLTAHERSEAITMELEFDEVDRAPRVRRRTLVLSDPAAPTGRRVLQEALADFAEGEAMYPTHVRLRIERAAAVSADNSAGQTFVREDHTLELTQVSCALSAAVIDQRARALLTPAPGVEVQDLTRSLRYRGGDALFTCAGKSYLSPEALASPLDITLSELIAKSRLLPTVDARE
jgi:hypothetical protein